MAILPISHLLSPKLLSAVIVAALLYFARSKYVLHRKRKAAGRAQGCLPCKAIYPIKDRILMSDLSFKIIGAAKQKKLLDFYNNMLQPNPTTLIASYLFPSTIFTIDSENIKSMLATSFDDWAIGPLRAPTQPLIGRGIFTTDGEFWAHSRQMLRPTFNKDQVADLTKLEDHLQAFLKLLPSDEATVDLQELFHRYTLDTSTEFLLGQSTYSLMPDRLEISTGFARAFDVALGEIITRIRAGLIYRILPTGKAAKKANKECRDFVGTFVHEAIARKEAPSEKDTALESKGRKEKYVFLSELVQQTDDQTRLTDEALSVLLAGRDTTASLLSDLWFQLARHPDLWRRIQEEVNELHGELPTYEQLKNMKLLKYTVNETLRLFPPVPILGKAAIRDTVIPVGGGPDGKSPIYIPKGGKVVYNSYALHRRKDVYGEDADVFNPDRWASPDLRPGWNFIPFGGGPRVCLGQQYALTETYYVTTRLMQEFLRVEARDPEPWKEKLTLTLASANGTKVALHRS